MPVRYFAYGSNMETATFCGRREIEFTQALAGRADGWRLVLDKPSLLPMGCSYANIVSDPSAHVFGVLYEIDEDGLAHLDLTEGVPIGNYARIEITVAPLAAASEPVRAYTLVSDRRAPELLPSQRYLGCVINGAIEHRLPDEWIAHLRTIPCQPETKAEQALRPLLADGLRRMRR